MIINDSKPRDWRPDEVDVFQEFAYRLSARIERARAEAMQRRLEEAHRSQLESKVLASGEELKKSKDLLQTVSDAADNLLCAFDVVYSEPGKVEDLELLMCNKVTAGIIGKTSEALAGSRYSELFPASSKNGAFERIKEVVRTGTPANFELWHSREETTRWFLCTVSKLNNMIILNGRDIAEWRKISQDEHGRSGELLQEAQKLTQQLANQTNLVREEVQNMRNTVSETPTGPDKNNDSR
jgi:PAS domain-containing protein